MPQKPICTRDPTIRSNLYKLLSTGFRYPTPELFKTFQNGELIDELMYNISAIPELNALMSEHLLMKDDEKDAMKGMTLAEFGAIFTRTFDTGTPVPPCPPYEGHYCTKPRSMIMLEVSEFYNFFGLCMSQEEGKREFPDHICAELEFLHFLTFKEGEALREGEEEKLKGYLLAQKDFLERHVIEWVPKFCIKLQNSEGVHFYAGLAQIASGFITYEFENIIK
ncbi:Chaperone protein TorD [uncultured archaeon]|nr:Chaperone protein TorD [uncultured archaeon]